MTGPGQHSLKSFLRALIVFAVLGIVSASVALMPCRAKATATEAGEVVVYTSQDEVYAELILSTFTQRTGIKVRPVYDSEAVKTVGLVNRLLAEKNRPRCDVFWNNEELRTRQLAAEGVLRQTNGFACFGFRSRRLVVNTNLVKLADAPATLAALTNKSLYGKVALAYPLFGTTSTHFLALKQAWGEQKWSQWCRALHANKPFVVDGNSVVVSLVGKGEAALGLTDSDDVLAGQKEGLPIGSIPLKEDGFFIQNTVAVIRNAPHPEAAQRVFEYLTSIEVLRALKEAGAVEGGGPLSTQTVDWPRLLETQAASVDELKGIFLR